MWRSVPSITVSNNHPEIHTVCRENKWQPRSPTIGMYSKSCHIYNPSYRGYKKHEDSHMWISGDRGYYTDGDCVEIFFDGYTAEYLVWLGLKYEWSMVVGYFTKLPSAKWWMFFLAMMGRRWSVTNWVKYVVSWCLMWFLSQGWESDWKFIRQDAMLSGYFWGGDECFFWGWWWDGDLWLTGWSMLYHDSWCGFSLRFGKLVENLSGKMQVFQVTSWEGKDREFQALFLGSHWWGNHVR